MKSNKIVQFPMVGFDPSAFLAKQSTNTKSSASSSESGVTTVNVKSSEELETEDEVEEKRERTSRHGSEVQCFSFLFFTDTTQQTSSLTLSMQCFLYCNIHRGAAPFKHFFFFLGNRSRLPKVQPEN